MGPCEDGGNISFNSASDIDLSSVITWCPAGPCAGAKATNVIGDADDGLGDVKEELLDEFGDACWGEPDDVNHEFHNPIED